MCARAIDVFSGPEIVEWPDDSRVAVIGGKKLIMNSRHDFTAYARVMLRTVERTYLCIGEPERLSVAITQ